MWTKVFQLGDGTHSRKQKVLEREAWFFGFWRLWRQRRTPWGFKAPGCLSHCEAQTVWQALRALAASWDLTILLRVSDLISRLVPLSQNLSWIRFRTSFGSLFNKNLSTSTCHDKRWLATIIAPSGFWLCRAMLRESVVWSFWTSHQKSWSVPSQRQTWTDTPPGRSLLITLW